MTVTLPVDVGDEDRILLVPRHENDYASVGTVAEVIERVRMPGGGQAIVVNGLHRGILGAAAGDPFGRLRVEVEERPDDQPRTGKVQELEREYRAIVEEILELRGADERVSAFLRAISEPGALADSAGYSPDLTYAQKVELLQTLDVAERLELAVRLVSVPWSMRSDERLDPVHAREVLDADHAGLDDVKDRIVEYLAVRKLRAERGIEDDRKSGAILTLIGPPGTGKTSIGESVARALGREFVRMSLGGVRDEAEIRGHRRTYIGALPGRLVRALRDAGTMNPVIMLDEVDKVGADWRGDPSSALLEVLDP